MATLFISDLHLEDSQPAVTGWLLDFLSGPARTADAVYILGDLFEYWSFRGPGQPRRHRLEFWIRPWQGDSAMMLLVPVINGRAEDPVARYLWQAPGELTSTGLSGPMVEAEKLKVFVQNVFLMEDNNTAKIEQWLRNNVPIGPESAWMEPGRPDSLMIALPLSIEEFGALQKSIFKISGRTPSGQTEGRRRA